MSESFRIDEAPLSVFFDLRQPRCYLALRPTLELGRELGIEINWLPIRVPPLKAPSPAGADDDRGVRHRRYRALAIAREIEGYADAQGLVIREPYRDDDPSAAYAAWLWVREQAADRLPELLERVFRAYWACELAPSDVRAVARVLEALGLDTVAFEAWEREHASPQLSVLAHAVDERGMAVGSPLYLAEGELFWGGQHLEMLRWMLGGRQGRGPI